MKKTYIIDAVRTPRAKRKGEYSNVHPVDLFTYPINEILKRNSIPKSDVDDVIAGCVTQSGEQAWCIARSAVLAAGLPDEIPGTTVNRLCGSGLQATHFAAQSIMADVNQLVVSGGIEHMTRVPMFSDCGGEESPLLNKFHPNLVPQGLSAEMMCERFNLSRKELDEYSAESQKRASIAQEENRFSKSLVEIPYTDDEGNSKVLAKDSTIRPGTTVEVLSKLKTVFKEDGCITAGNASSIVDGAATVLLASEEKSKSLNLKPRAIIKSMVSIGSEPEIMLTGPVEASRKALKKASMSINDIDLWEINEAFAPVVLYTMNELKLDHSLVNVNGGGISLGHPLGATGAMLLGTALDELERQDKNTALITMCIGLGMGIATIIERV